MGTKIEKTVQPQQEQTPPQETARKKQEAKNDSFEISNLLSKGAAVVMAPITAAAGVGYLAGKFVEGVVTTKSIDQDMTEGIQTVGDGADMLDRMWNGKYF